MTDKIRLDQYLVEKGLCPSREKARAVIMAGQVYVGGQKADKAGLFLKPGEEAEVRGRALPYVSRGGLKLEKALSVFPISPAGKIAMDAGASTGGFTDCMLQNGAKKVYAVDVGYGQLAWQLRSDARVVNLERTNVRYLTKEQVPEPIQFLSVDVSFISLLTVLPAILPFLKPGAQAVCLIKPQFEAGREFVGKKGVVRDRSVHVAVCQKVMDFCQNSGLALLGLTFSPVKGPEGNIEYLLCFAVPDGPAEAMQQTLPDVQAVVTQSHEELEG